MKGFIKEKKSIIKALSVLMIITMCLLQFNIVFAVENTDTEYTSGDYSYTIKDDGTAEIAKYNGKETNITIPSKLDGKLVTSIGNYAFENYKTATSVTIPEGITTIGVSSFRFCEAMTSVSLPSTLTTIKNGAFSFCNVLDNVVVPDSVTTIEKSGFQDCLALTNIKLSDSLSIISEFTFFNCPKLEKIDFPSNLKIIDQNSFAHCPLVNLVIPEGVTEIKTAAFSYCENLESVKLPETLTNIGAYAFTTCLKLKEITVPDSVTEVGILSLGYRWDNVKWDYVKIDDFVIKGYKNSVTNQYATEYGLNFESIGDSKNPVATTTVPTTTVDPTAPSTTIDPTSVINVYYKNTKNLSNVYAYYWVKNSTGPIAWPGKAMTKVKDDIYVVEVPANCNMIIFSDKGSNQTGNLDIPGKNYIYDGSKWEVYSENPTESTTDNALPSTTNTEPTTKVEPTTVTTNTEPTTTTPEKHMFGDANGDGLISIKDATYIQKAILSTDKITDYLKKYGDINGDGIVNVKDATIIQKYVTGLSVGYEIGKYI